MVANGFHVRTSSDHSVWRNDRIEWPMLFFHKWVFKALTSAQNVIQNVTGMTEFLI
jgi:glucan biosynthesis protein